MLTITSLFAKFPLTSLLPSSFPHFFTSFYMEKPMRLFIVELL